MTNWIHVDDAYSQFVQASLNAMRSDVDQERTWLLSTKRPIQPDGQVWPVAVALVDAWDRWLSRREQWYAQRSAHLARLEASIEGARGHHRSAEETATDLAGKGMN